MGEEVEAGVDIMVEITTPLWIVEMEVVAATMVEAEVVVAGTETLEVVVVTTTETSGIMEKEWNEIMTEDITEVEVVAWTEEALVTLMDAGEGTAATETFIKGFVFKLIVLEKI